MKMLDEFLLLMIQLCNVHAFFQKVVYQFIQHNAPVSPK